MADAADILTRARQLHRGGDPTSAVPLYRQFLEAEPEHAEAHALLGLAYHQLNDFAAAVASYRRAIELHPGEADLHLRLGLALASLGRPDEAAAAFAEAARLRPEAPEAWNNLGNIYLLQDRADEAVAAYRRAVRVRPDFADACLNLAAALREDDRPAESLTWYREALRLRPGWPKALIGLGSALLETGETGDAEKSLRAALQQEPGAPAVLCVLVSNGLYRPDDPGPDDLRARLTRGGLSDTDRSLLHLTLAHVLDRAGDHGHAFQHFAEGNRLRRQLLRAEGISFNAAEHDRLVQRLREAFTPAFFSAARGFGLDSDVPVFIVGMPRSGSSLVEQILASHPSASGAGELRALPRLAAGLPGLLGTTVEYPECVAGLDAPAARQDAGAYLARLRRDAPAAARVSDKMLENFHHLGLAAALLPGARVIHCVRDALDVAASCFTQVFRGMEFSLDLEDLATYYAGYRRLMDHWRAVLPIPIHDVAYEDLVTGPERVTRRLIEFCGLPWDDRCLRPQENPRAVRTVSKLQVRRPVYATSVGRWRRFAGQLAPFREALARRGIAPPSC